MPFLMFYSPRFKYIITLIAVCDKAHALYGLTHDKKSCSTIQIPFV